jgi:hypothetical protein
VVDLNTATLLKDYTGSYTAEQCAGLCSDYTTANPLAPCLGATVVGTYGSSKGVQEVCSLKGQAAVTEFNVVSDVIVRQDYTCNGYTDGQELVDVNGTTYTVRCGADLFYYNVGFTTAQSPQQCAADCDVFNAQNPNGELCVAGVFVNEPTLASQGLGPGCNLKSFIADTQSSGTYDAVTVVSTLLGGNSTCGGYANGATFTEGGNEYEVSCYTLDYNSGLNPNVYQTGTTGFSDCAQKCDDYAATNSVDIKVIYLNVDSTTCYCRTGWVNATTYQQGGTHQALLIGAVSSSSSSSISATVSSSASESVSIDFSSLLAISFSIPFAPPMSPTELPTVRTRDDCHHLSKHC